MNELILASSSRYRAESLRRFNVPFVAINPDIDETQQAGESPQQLVVRLAEEKARAVSQNHPQTTVIGSDQVCSFAGKTCGKPHTKDNAVKQLQLFSDNCIDFFTGLCVITADGAVMTHVDHTVVEFRRLQTEEINRYVDTEQPLDCAGSFKTESLGLSLFKSIHSSDPSALIGLPLIKLGSYLRMAGYAIP